MLVVSKEKCLVGMVCVTLLLTGMVRGMTVTDGFNFTDGTLSGKGTAGEGWAGAWIKTKQYSLSVNNGNAVGGPGGYQLECKRDFTTPISITAGSPTIWLSFELLVDLNYDAANPLGNSQDVVGLIGAGTYGRLGKNTPEGNLKWSAYVKKNSPYYEFSSTDVPDNVWSKVCVKLVPTGNGYANYTMWVDPNYSLAENDPAQVSPMLSGTLNLGNTTIPSVVVYSSYYTSKNISHYDNLRVSTDSSPFGLVTTAKPVFSPAGGYLASEERVTISCDTPGAQIHYTLDETEPTQTSPLYTVPIAVGNQTLIARAWAPNCEPGEATIATYKACNNPGFIPRADGSVNVDGNLSEWQVSEFVPLDKNYSGTSPITDAAYAVRWDGTTNRFYVAVKVNDPTHVFEDMYSHWDTQDGVEVYIHTTGTEPYTYETAQNTAQQYVLGLKTPASRTVNPQANVWTTFAGLRTVPWETVGFQAAGVEEKDGQGNPTGWLFYEVAMTAYQWLPSQGEPLPGKDPVTDSSTPVVSPLSLGAQVGVDAIVCDRWIDGTTAKFSMKSENMLQTKYNDWRQIGLHQLAMHPADFNGDGKFSSTDIDLLFVQVKNGQNDPDYDLTGDGFVTQSDMDVLVLTLCRSRYGDANGDGSVDVGDLGILAANYGGASKTWNLGDFNGDGSVDVGDLGILAANYGASRSSFEADFAKVFGAATVDEESEEESSSTLCSGLGLPMIIGLVLMGLMWVKVDE